MILVLAGHYLPSFKAGGALRSLVNLVDGLGDHFHFRIVTGDRDLGDSTPFPNVAPGTWKRLGKADVLYLSRNAGFPAALLRLLKREHYDALYITTFFDPLLLFLPLLARRLGLVPLRPTLIAPQGQFMEGALRARHGRKVAYRAVVRRALLRGDEWWQASSGLEAAEIARMSRSRDRPALVARDIPARAPGALSHAVKVPGRLRTVFLSRISPKKNLDGALQLLRGVPGEVELNIFGPVEDQEYWRQCQAIAASLPPNVRVVLHGEVVHDRVAEVLAAHDLFLFPTRGENYGHVIAEALVAGCPVLLSDQTPWRNLSAARAGWDIPLTDEESFRQVLAWAIAADDAAWSEWRDGARVFGLKAVDPAQAIEAHHRMFDRVLGRG